MATKLHSRLVDLTPSPANKQTPGEDTMAILPFISPFLCMFGAAFELQIPTPDALKFLCAVANVPLLNDILVKVFRYFFFKV